MKGDYDMTGKDLIIYILQNNLENKEIFKDGVFVGLMTEEEAASKFGVGLATINIWHKFGNLKGIKIGNSLYFPKDAKDPRKSK